MSQRLTRQLAAAVTADLRTRPELAGAPAWDALVRAAAEARACTARDAPFHATTLRAALKPVVVAVHEAGHAVGHVKGEAALESRLLRLEWYGPGPAHRPPGPGVDAATLAQSVERVHPGLTRAALLAVLAGPHIVPVVFPRSAAVGLVPTEAWGPDLEFALEIQHVMRSFFQDAWGLRLAVLRRVRGEAFVRAVLPVAAAFLAAYPGGALDGEEVRRLIRQARRLPG